MTKDELLAEVETLKAHVADFAQPRVLGNEIVGTDGGRWGQWETAVNGEEHIVGYVNQRLDQAADEIRKLEGRKEVAAPSGGVEP